MRPSFHVTYEIITSESAEDADAAERGFVLPGWQRVVLPDHVAGQEAAKIKARCGLTLRQAAELIGFVEDSGHWFAETDGTKHYGTGDLTIQALHPPRTITASSYARLRRLLKAEG